MRSQLHHILQVKAANHTTPPCYVHIRKIQMTTNKTRRITTFVISAKQHNIIGELINGLCKAFCDFSGRDSSHVSITLFCSLRLKSCLCSRAVIQNHTSLFGNVQPPQSTENSTLTLPLSTPTHAMTARHAHVYLPIAACACGEFKETSVQWFGCEEQCCQILLEK